MNRPPLIIAFVGMPGTGKDTCSDYLATRYGWPVIHFGQMVYEEVQRRGLNNIENEIAVRQDMRRQDGPAVLAKRAAAKARQLAQTGARAVIFEGLYSWSEYQYLAGQFESRLIVIALAAAKSLRRQRVLQRQDSHRRYNLEQLIQREVSEIENLEKGGPIAYADYTLVNDGQRSDLMDRLEDIIGRLIDKSSGGSKKP